MLYLDRFFQLEYPALSMSQREQKDSSVIGECLSIGQSPPWAVQLSIAGHATLSPHWMCLTGVTVLSAQPLVLNVISPLMTSDLV